MSFRKAISALASASTVLAANAWNSAYKPRVVTDTSIYTHTFDTITFNVTFGNADVYTTIDSIPHAHGELKATSTSQSVGTYIEYKTTTLTSSTSESVAFFSPSPNCTIGTPKCINLWEAYLERHGLPTTIDNVTEPAITPIPTDRPRCSVGTVDLSCAPEKTRCIISANKVDLFYWPAPTAAPNASHASNATTAVFRNITITSPSVYLIFDHLQALTSGVVMETCSFSSPLGATATVAHLGPAASLHFIGGPYTNAVVSLDPTSLQSLVRDLGPAINTASVASEIAHGGPNYYHWINNVLGSVINYYGGYLTNVTALPVDFSNMKVPSAEAYYLNINGPFGCNRMGDHPQCSTIYDGAYRAQLLVPDQVRSLRPEWATCYDPLYGAYDPPIALTPAATIKQPGTGPDLQTKPPIALTLETTIVKPAPGPTGSSAPKETTKSKDDNPDPTIPSGAKPTDGGSDQSRPNEGNSNPPDSEPPAVSDPAPPDSSNDKSNGSDENDSTMETNSEDSSNDSQPENQDPKANNPSPADPASNSQGGSNAGDSNAGDSNEAAHNVLDGLLGAAKESNAASNGESQSPTNDSGSSAQGDNASSGEKSEADSNSSPGKGGSSEGDITSNDHSTPQSGGNSEGNGADGASAGDSETGSSDSPSSNESAGSQNRPENQNSGSSNDVNPNDENESQTNDQSPEQVIILNGAKHTVATPNGHTAIDGTTLAADGSPTTIDGQAMRAVDGGVVIGTQTVPLTADNKAHHEQGPAAVFTADGHKLTASPGSSGVAVIDGTTISVDGDGMTAHGATMSAASNGIFVDGTTVPFETEVASDDGIVLTLVSDTLGTASSVSSGVFAIGSRTLTVGGPDATTSGHVVSAASSGVVVDSSSISTGQGGMSSSTGTSDASLDARPAEQTTSGAARSMRVRWAVVVGFSLLLMV